MAGRRQEAHKQIWSMLGWSLRSQQAALPRSMILYPTPFKACSTLCACRSWCTMPLKSSTARPDATCCSATTMSLVVNLQQRPRSSSTTLACTRTFASLRQRYDRQRHVKIRACHKRSIGLRALEPGKCNQEMQFSDDGVCLLSVLSIFLYRAQPSLAGISMSDALHGLSLPTALACKILTSSLKSILVK